MVRTSGELSPIGELGAFFERGLSFMAATRDDRGVVELVRAAGARLVADGRVMVAIPIPEGERTLANIERTRVIALNAAWPIDYQSRQLKGTDAALATWPELDAVVVEHRQRFVDALKHVGFPPGYSAALWSPHAKAVVFTPLQVFDQTPGPAAGLPVPP